MYQDHGRGPDGHPTPCVGPGVPHSWTTASRMVAPGQQIDFNLQRPYGGQQMNTMHLPAGHMGASMQQHAYPQPPAASPQHGGVYHGPSGQTPPTFGCQMHPSSCEGTAYATRQAQGHDNQGYYGGTTPYVPYQMSPQGAVPGYQQQQQAQASSLLEMQSAGWAQPAGARPPTPMASPPAKESFLAMQQLLLQMSMHQHVSFVATPRSMINYPVLLTERARPRPLLPAPYFTFLFLFSFDVEVSVIEGPTFSTAASGGHWETRAARVFRGRNCELNTMPMT